MGRFSEILRFEGLILDLKFCQFESSVSVTSGHFLAIAQEQKWFQIGCIT
ncbi:hypothetical protein ACE6H2_022682 [Prunus campanulata]